MDCHVRFRSFFPRALGVAAHITAASPGGPRYDPKLSSEERSGHGNGIWLCQNCAKLVDNDPALFSVDVLKTWKNSAEEESKGRVGKTSTSIIRGSGNSIEIIEALRAIQRGQRPDRKIVEKLHQEGLIEVIDVTHMQSPGREFIPGLLTAEGLNLLGSGNAPLRAAAFPVTELKVYDRVRISPIIPKEHEQSDFRITEDKGTIFIFQKVDSMRYVDIPKSFIEKTHSFDNSKPALVQLIGRLQWVSAKRNFELFPEKPPASPADVYGIGKDVDLGYPGRQRITGKFGREDRLPEILTGGWYVFYDSDGKFLRLPGREVNQILVVDWV